MVCIFSSKDILRDPKVWLLTTFCSSSNLAETKASRVLGSISFCVFAGDLVAGVLGEVGLTVLIDFLSCISYCLAPSYFFRTF